MIYNYKEDNKTILQSQSEELVASGRFLVRRNDVLYTGFMRRSLTISSIISCVLLFLLPIKVNAFVLGSAPQPSSNLLQKLAPVVLDMLSFILVLAIAFFALAIIYGLYVIIRGILRKVKYRKKYLIIGIIGLFLSLLLLYLLMMIFDIFRPLPT
jgi:hypothetical protein